MSQIEPWDQRTARFLVRPLASSWVRPNHVTAVTLVMVLTSGVLFGTGDVALMHWAAGLFVLARYLDHFDGELARLQGPAPLWDIILTISWEASGTRPCS